MMLQDACAEGVRRRIQAATRMQSPVLLQHPQLHETMENGPPLDVPDLGCEILESECLFSSEMQRALKQNFSKQFMVLILSCNWNIIP
jgi:hypothetical protein